METIHHARNVLGEPLALCCDNPVTGFTRSGFCETNTYDVGLHAVCARVTAEFLAFSLEQGNDLVTPRPEAGFPGLKPGDQWCLCAARWQQALEADVAPPVLLMATNETALEVCSLADLKAHAIDLS
ncbi:uncharacterized protein (DUF2237 family) [Natronocella acetinitrilica]|uniref:Uncharacterized protein (DUF2237 family) n=1 Tax=Natronocella acetinitrilica TaxID=414046 RepID=A0AAE3G989_9GAMM|nr:DUF2237 domain-containing protein [Natronocella acetinitrilica]MCP1676137.1 uncharacterized protein (DUF2237 family) [Natronocella acetinitrilica]